MAPVEVGLAVAGAQEASAASVAREATAEVVTLDRHNGMSIRKESSFAQSCSRHEPSTNGRCDGDFPVRSTFWALCTIEGRRHRSIPSKVFGHAQMVAEPVRVVMEVMRVVERKAKVAAEVEAVARAGLVVVQAPSIFSSPIQYCKRR